MALGDVELRYTVSGTGGSLEVEFSNFRGFSETPAYNGVGISLSNRMNEWTIRDIAVRLDGTFHKGGYSYVPGDPLWTTWAYGEEIEGAFFGTDHAETAGVFRNGRVIGAFGAKRD